MRILLFILCLLSMETYSAESLAIQDKINQLMVNPYTLLDELKESFENEKGTFTQEDRERLLEQLEQMKAKLSYRPWAGPLKLPIYAVFALGTKIFLGHVALKDSPLEKSVFFQKEYLDLKHEFLKDCFIFIPVFLISMLLQLDHYVATKDVYKKEEVISSKIDGLIQVLKR